MSIYKEIYDEVKNLDKDGILSYLENKDEESSKFKIRTSIDGKMTECSIEYLEGLKTIDDNILSILRIKPIVFITFAAEYIRKTKTDIRKLREMIMLDLHYRVDEKGEVDILNVNKIVSEFCMDDGYISVDNRYPDFSIDIEISELSKITRDNKLEDLMKYLDGL